MKLEKYKIKGGGERYTEASIFYIDVVCRAKSLSVSDAIKYIEEEERAKNASQEKASSEAST